MMSNCASWLGRSKKDTKVKGPGAKILHVGAYESEDIATVHNREKVVEEKCQTSIKLDHLVLKNMLAIKTDNCVILDKQRFTFCFACFDMISLVRLATMFRMSSLNCSENLRQWENAWTVHVDHISHLCFLGACNVLAVARCSTIALIMSSKKNQEQSVTASLVESLDSVSWRASCSWTSFPRLVVPSAASAPRSPPVHSSRLYVIDFINRCQFSDKLIWAKSEPRISHSHMIQTHILSVVFCNYSNPTTINPRNYSVNKDNVLQNYYSLEWTVSND